MGLYIELVRECLNLHTVLESTDRIRYDKVMAASTVSQQIWNGIHLGFLFRSAGKGHVFSPDVL